MGREVPVAARCLPQPGGVCGSLSPPGSRSLLQWRERTGGGFDSAFSEHTPLGFAVSSAEEKEAWGCLFPRSGRDRTASEGEWLLSGFHGCSERKERGSHNWEEGVPLDQTSGSNFSRRDGGLSPRVAKVLGRIRSVLGREPTRRLRLEGGLASLHSGLRGDEIRSVLGREPVVVASVREREREPWGSFAHSKFPSRVSRVRITEMGLFSYGLRLGFERDTSSSPTQENGALEARVMDEFRSVLGREPVPRRFAARSFSPGRDRRRESLLECTNWWASSVPLVRENCFSSSQP